jgi:hypothetical protein
VGNAAKEAGKPFLVANWPQEIDIPERMIDSIINIDLINDLLEYSNRLRRLNGDFNRFNCITMEVRQALLAGTIDDPTYLNFYQRGVDGISIITKHVEDIRANTFDLLAKVRVLSRKMVPLFNRIVKISSIRKYPANITDLVGEESKKLVGELKQNIEKSIKTNERALSK